MRLAAIRHALPARTMTNDWIREQVKRRNSGLSNQQSERLDSRVATYLEHAGTRIRYTVAEGERAVALALAAARSALDTAGVPLGEIEFVIYAGEGHRISKPEHRRDINRRAIAWFDAHLK